jgi:hypothetical protein
MMYHGTSNTETIWFGPENDIEEVHYIELYKADDEQVFYVTTCCNDDWVWAFKMDASANYEMIKFTILDEMFDCCCINNLLDTLDAIFAEDFADILVEDKDEDACECGCNGNCCEQCNHRDCLN